MTLANAPLSEQLMLPQGLAASLELIINKVLSLPSAHGSLEKLADKTLALTLAEFGFTLSITFTPDNNDKKILVTALTERADCSINTSINTLRELQANQQLTELIKQDKLAVTGDIKVAQQFASFAQNIDIDWQSELAAHIGDVPTYNLAQLGKKLSAKLNFAAAQIQADASEYIVHEKRLVVTKSQIQTFNQQVNEVSEHFTLLEARLAKLSKKLTN